MKRIDVLHVVPALGIGGVEVGIARSYEALSAVFRYNVCALKLTNKLRIPRTLIWNRLAALLARPPTVVITSLWPSHVFGWLLSMRGSRWIGFLHSSHTFGLRDLTSHRLFLPRCDALFVDSTAAGQLATKLCGSKRQFLVPFVFPQKRVIAERQKNRFVYVGRNARVKRLDIATNIAEALLPTVLDSSFCFVIAGKAPSGLRDLQLRYPSRVDVLENLDNEMVHEQLARAEYYLLTSDHEGYSLSCGEAVQQGCFVIYRDVGAIREYVDPSYSFQLTETQNMRTEILALCSRRIGVPMRPPQERAVGKPGYVDSFVNGVHSTLATQ